MDFVLIVIVLSAAVCAGLLVYLAAQLVPARAKAVDRRLSDIRAMAADDTWSRAHRRQRRTRREMVEAALEAVGGKLEERYHRDATTRELLVQAGYRQPNAEAYYWGIRVALTAGLAVLALSLLPLAGLGAGIGILGALYMGAMGWVFPVMLVRQKKKARQKEIQLALPDALDLMVVCVEAGLALNQALLRVAEEIRFVSSITAQEFALVNLEIRAGTPRESALKRLGERTGVEDLRSLVTMLIQTDRFGTSVATSLRVHADTLRMKRRQRAEEAAAKTTIKMIFPLVFCIFPALFVVILGPGLIMIFRALAAF